MTSINRPNAARAIVVVGDDVVGGPSPVELPERLRAAFTRVAADGVLVVHTRDGAAVSACAGTSVVRIARTARALTELWLAGPAAPPLVELCGRPAPEPLELVLRVVASLASGEVLLAHLPHVPRPLFPHLAQRGVAWEAIELDDRTALLHVRRS